MYYGDFSPLYFSTRNNHQSTSAGPPAVQTYMELDPRTREGQQVYQEPQSQQQGAEFSTYEDIGQGSNTRDDAYQELDQPTIDNSASKAYVNVPQWNRGKKGKQ